MSRETGFYLRRFLNTEEHQGTAFVEAKVTEAEAGRSDSDYVSFDGNFIVADCTRKIDLDFYVSSEEDIENAFVKISRLKNGLAQFEQAFRTQVANFRRLKGAK